MTSDTYVDNMLDRLKTIAKKIKVNIDSLDDIQRRKRSDSIQFSNQYEIDVIADNIVHSELSDFDGYILSEEREIDKSQLESNRNILVIDPIDGSTNASRKIGYWCFSAALISDGQVIAGIVVDQVNGRTFIASESQAPSMIDQTGLITNLDEVQVDEVGLLVDNFPMSLINYNSHDGPPLPFRHLRHFGSSALAICDVASGSFDAYIDGADVLLKPWDLLAAEYIAKRAGCYTFRRDSQGIFVASGVLIARSDQMLKDFSLLFPDFFRN